MKSTLRGYGLALASSLLFLISGCGGGGNTPPVSLNVNHPPVTTAPTWAPPDATLAEYTTYTFTTVGTDPDLGDTVASYEWDFGDGTAHKITTSPSVTHAYTSVAAYIVRVAATDNHGLQGAFTGTSVSLKEAPNPFTLSEVTPSDVSTLRILMGSTVQVAFSIQVADTDSGLITAAGVVLDPNDATAIVGTPTTAGGGLWNIPVTYSSAAAVGTRTVNPTVQVQDSLGISSPVLNLAAVTINTISSTNPPPVITLAATPAIVAGTNATWQNVPIAFVATAVDPNNNPLTYTWTFGDGGKGDISNSPDSASLKQTHTYTSPGIYSATFTGSNGSPNGQKTITVTLNILANGAPVVSVLQSPAGSNIYAGVPVTFTTTATDPDGDVPSLTWDFGDTGTGTGSPVTHVFSAAGNNTVTLKADDGKGGVTLWTTNLTVVANHAPVAALATPPATLYQSKSYTFTASATDQDAGDTISQYQWDFGDGTPVQTTAGPSASHTYAPGGATAQMPVRVLAVDNHGAVGNFSPAVNFTVASTDLPVATFKSITAVTLNANMGETVSYAYLVQVTNPRAGTAGVVDPIPVANLTFLPNDPAGTVTSIVSNGGGVYTVNVSYVGAGALGVRTSTPSIAAMDTLNIQGLPGTGPVVTLNTIAGADNPPVITMAATPAFPAGTNATWQNVLVTFKATATDPLNSSMTYSWSFNDGGKGDITGSPDPATLTQTHTFATVGLYSVTFTASDGRAAGLKSVTLTVNILANAPPVVSVVQSPAGNPYAGVPITFTATATEVSGGTPTLTWDFGDTGTDKGAKVTHTFLAAGNDTVTLTADDGMGGVTTWTTSLAIQSNHPPVATLTTSPATLYQAKAYTFMASATDPDAGDTISQYQWDFGDGSAVQTTTGASASHTYTAGGATAQMPVRVLAVDNHNAPGAFSPAVNFTVANTPLPVATFKSATPVTLNANTGETVNYAYLVQVTNPRAGTPGVVDPIPVANLTFLTNDPTGTVTSIVSNGGGIYTVNVSYVGAGALGVRTSTPSVAAMDTLNIQGLPSTGPVVTLNTIAGADNPPVTTMVATPAIPAGTNATWQNVAVTFKATATDPLNSSMTYSWSFNDGGKGDISGSPDSATLTQTHTFANVGLYSVTFTASDGRAAGLKTVTLTINILANGPPVVSVVQNPLGNPYVGVPITFTATATEPSGGTPTLTWNFGDTGTATGAVVTHTFLAAGNDTVTLTADDGMGGVTLWTASLAVQANHPPVATLIPPAATLYQSKIYTFTASTVDPDAGDTVTQYQWDFGDGSPVQYSAGPSIPYSYATGPASTPAVRVMARDNHGAWGVYSPAVTLTVVATPLPVVSFQLPSAPLTLNSEINGYVTQDFVVQATNPRAGTPGVVDPIPVGNFTFLPNDPSASVTAAVSNGGGKNTFTVKYSGATAQGTRNSIPTVSVVDSLGIRSLTVSAPAVTINTLGANHAPTIALVTPATDNTVAWTSKPFSLTYLLTDQDNDSVVSTVDWGDGTTQTIPAPAGQSSAGLSVTVTHSYKDGLTNTTQPVSIVVTATDNRSSNSNASAQTRLVVVTYNAPPTAKITSPQPSGTPPTGLQAGINAPYVVVPLNGAINFTGVATVPGSGDAVTTAWTFPQGSPSTASSLSVSNVLFGGSKNAITPVLATFTVTDAFNRTATATTQVLIDGVNTQLFNLAFLYRTMSDNNNALSSLSPVTTAANGLGANIQLFQDGLTNTYNVQNQVAAAGATAAVSIPVRSDLPFYIQMPGFADATTQYLMRIPNAPTGPYSDPALAAVAPGGSNSSFSFANTTPPYNPTLQVVTAQGFAAENTTASQRQVNGYTDIVLGGTPAPSNNRWVDRLSIPGTDAKAIPWTDSNTNVFTINIPGNQTFAEWPTLLLTRITSDLSDSTLGYTGESPKDPSTAAAQNGDLAFVLDYPTYSPSTAKSATFSAFAMQTYRVPATSTDPYQLSPVWQTLVSQTLNAWPTPPWSTEGTEMDNTYWRLDNTGKMVASSPHAGLNPTQVSAGMNLVIGNLVAPYSNTVVPPVAGTAFSGSIGGLYLPYAPNDPSRTPLAASTLRLYSGEASVFTYAEYLWSTVWARPLVLNVAHTAANADPSSFSYYRYSNPTDWPKAHNISPDNSAFDLTVRGGGSFDGRAPVGLNGSVPPATGVGRFFWTAYTPSYEGDSNSGGAIARTWLSSDSTKQLPAVVAGSPTGDATVAMGFMPPQDTMVDKRGRNADGSLNGSSSGGYRVTWYNPTQDASQNPVPPDFWVVELLVGTTKYHFMLPANYPSAQSNPGQVANCQMMTDCRTYLPSGHLAQAGPVLSGPVLDTVGPGYCWFDIPVELRPTGTNAALVTVFGIKSILKNNPVTAARALVRPDWIDAMNTATAKVKLLVASGKDLSYAYKIPFNFDWDIVITNGPQTLVQP